MPDLPRYFHYFHKCVSWCDSHSLRKHRGPSNGKINDLSNNYSVSSPQFYENYLRYGFMLVANDSLNAP